MSKKKKEVKKKEKKQPEPPALGVQVQDTVKADDKAK
jgi:hypothetical protein